MLSTTAGGVLGAAGVAEAAEALAELPKEEEVGVQKKTSLRMPSNAPEDFLAGLDSGEAEQDEEEEEKGE